MIRTIAKKRTGDFSMRKEYDLERLTVTWRGLLPGLSGIPEAPETDVEDKVQSP
jgi:hypothetical protein